MEPEFRQIKMPLAGTGIGARPDPATVLASVGEVVYRWTLSSDRLEWGENARRVLHLPDSADISTGRAFAHLAGPGGCGRHDAVICAGVPDLGDGVRYRIEYAFQPAGADGETLWVEDVGRWYAGMDKRPSWAEGVVRVINDRHQREEEAAYLSHHDPLTGQLNRAALTERLEQTIGAISRGQGHACFLLASIDSLSVINDAYGFAVADELLIGVAARIREVMRSGDALGRFAGNKFGLLVGSCTESEMEIAAARFLSHVAGTPLEVSVGPVPVTVSIGGVAMPRHARNVQEACIAAQEALSQARTAGRGSFAAYTLDPALEARRRRNIDIADSLVRALNDNRVLIALDPVIDARSGGIAFHECLARVVTSEGEIVAACDFIELAEKLGVVRHIDMRVLDLAVAHLDENPDDTLSVNVSMLTACHPEWYSRLSAHVIARPGIAGRIIVEITETVAIEDIERAARFVQSLRDLGCTIAIDDFGAGFTNYRNLRLLDADMVKIDGGFICNYLDSPDDQVFVHTLIELARHARLKVVAEWVEDRETWNRLAEAGVDFIQGKVSGGERLLQPEEAPDAAATQRYGAA